jgi:hypothetical protein
MPRKATIYTKIDDRLRGGIRISKQGVNSSMALFCALFAKSRF